MPADDTQSSSWGSSQRPASHLRRSLAAAGRRSTRQTRLRTSEWMHQGGTMAHQQVHRSRWIACRRRSAAPSITISRLSRGKTVEKCTGSRPARNKKSPSRWFLLFATWAFGRAWEGAEFLSLLALCVQLEDNCSSVSLLVVGTFFIVLSVVQPLSTFVTVGGCWNREEPSWLQLQLRL